MSKMFVKKDQLSLKNGGYLVIGENETPVTNEEFVKAQVECHYLISLAAKVKVADFTVKTPTTFEAIVAGVKADLNNESRVYVIAPETVATPVTDSLKSEALLWLKSQSEGTKAEKLNKILSKFDVLAEFNDYGLFFQDGIIKLKKIYSIDEVVEAVKILEPHLQA